MFAESLVSFSSRVYQVDEDAGEIHLPIIRRGADLTQPTTLWCGTKMAQPLSATPGQDYVPRSQRIHFAAGQTIQVKL